MENEIKESRIVISVMLAVTDAPAAVAWYEGPWGYGIMEPGFSGGSGD